MKVYISGQISGIEGKAPLFFKQAQLSLEQDGHQVVNPIELPHNHNKTWSEFMREDLKAMMDCDAIYLLKNFTTSKGAMTELYLAQSLGMKILFQADFMHGVEMTKQEALVALDMGHKLKHKYFSGGEFVSKINEITYQLSDCECFIYDFWLNRTGESFEKGWYLLY